MKFTGARLARVVLFGSPARREARPDSDYDMAVFLKRYPIAGPNSTGLLICVSASLMPPPYSPPLAGKSRVGKGTPRLTLPLIPRPDTVDT